MGNDRDQIADVIEHYRHGLEVLDADELKGIWDQRHEPLTYIAMERAEAITDWDGIAAYYDLLARGVLKTDRMEIDSVVIDVLGDTATAYLRFSFEGSIRDQKRTAEGRITLVLHRVGDDWRVVQYHESGRGPQGA